MERTGRQARRLPSEQQIPDKRSCRGRTSVQALPILNVFRNYWTIKDPVIENTERGIYLDGVTGVNITNNIVRNFHADGIALYNGANNNTVQNNVIGYGDACVGEYDDAGVFSYQSSNNKYLNNIFVATGNNEHQLGGKNGYGLQLNGSNNTVQGNLFLANAGKAVTRVFANDTSWPANENVIRDNAMLFGEGDGRGDG